MELNIKRKKLIEFAKKFIGVPYKYGAKMNDAPNFFDCSGFIKYIFSEIGYGIPRSTIEQAEFAGIKIDNLNKLKIGDLIFLHGKQGHYNETFPKGIGHVVMYCGEENIIHATSKRISKIPGSIKEIGGIEISNLPKLIKAYKPVIIIKRIINN